MIEIYAPFVLLLINWNPDDPKVSMEISQRVYIGIEECMAAGREVETLREAEPEPGIEFTWRCLRQQNEIEVYRPLPRGDSAATGEQ